MLVCPQPELYKVNESIDETNELISEITYILFLWEYLTTKHFGKDF